MDQSAQVGSFLNGTVGILVTLAIGAIIGWLGSIVMKTNAQMGLVANVIVGIIGAWLGAFLAGQLGMGTSPIGAILFAVIGASLFIFILKALGIFK